MARVQGLAGGMMCTGPSAKSTCMQTLKAAIRLSPRALLEQSTKVQGMSSKTSVQIRARRSS